MIIIIIMPFIIRQYVKNSIQLFAFLFAFILFAGDIIVSSYRLSLNVRNNNEAGDKKIRVFFKSDPLVNNDGSLVPIINNSQYFFLFDRKSNKVIIVPFENINYIIKNAN